MITPPSNGKDGGLEFANDDDGDLNRSLNSVESVDDDDDDDDDDENNTSIDNSDDEDDEEVGQFSGDEEFIPLLNSISNSPPLQSSQANSNNSNSQPSSSIINNTPEATHPNASPSTIIPFIPSPPSLHHNTSISSQNDETSPPPKRRSAPSMTTTSTETSIATTTASQLVKDSSFHLTTPPFLQLQPSTPPLTQIKKNIDFGTITPNPWSFFTNAYEDDDDENEGGFKTYSDMEEGYMVIDPRKYVFAFHPGSSNGVSGGGSGGGLGRRIFRNSSSSGSSLSYDDDIGLDNDMDRSGSNVSSISNGSGLSSDELVVSTITKRKRSKYDANSIVSSYLRTRVPSNQLQLQNQIQNQNSTLSLVKYTPTPQQQPVSLQSSLIHNFLNPSPSPVQVISDLFTETIDLSTLTVKAGVNLGRKGVRVVWEEGSYLLGSSSSHSLSSTSTSNPNANTSNALTGSKNSDRSPTSSASNTPRTPSHGQQNNSSRLQRFRRSMKVTAREANRLVHFLAGTRWRSEEVQKMSGSLSVKDLSANIDKSDDSDSPLLNNPLINVNDSNSKSTSSTAQTNASSQSPKNHEPPRPLPKSAPNPNPIPLPPQQRPPPLFTQITPTAPLIIQSDLLRRLDRINRTSKVLNYLELPEGISKVGKKRVQRMMHYEVSLRCFICKVEARSVGGVAKVVVPPTPAPVLVRNDSEGGEESSDEEEEEELGELVCVGGSTADATSKFETGASKVSGGKKRRSRSGSSKKAAIKKAVVANTTTTAASGALNTSTSANPETPQPPSTDSANQHNENASPFMCTPQSFPPTPYSRSFVLSRSSQFAEDVLFLARDQLRVDELVSSYNMLSRRTGENLKSERLLAVWNALDSWGAPNKNENANGNGRSNIPQQITLTLGQHQLLKIPPPQTRGSGSVVVGEQYVSSRGMIPVLRNCWVYFEVGVGFDGSYIEHLLRNQNPLSSSSSLSAQNSNLNSGVLKPLPSLSIGLSPQTMPLNSLVGSYKYSIGLVTTGQILEGGRWVFANCSGSGSGSNDANGSNGGGSGLNNGTSTNLVGLSGNDDNALNVGSPASHSHPTMRKSSSTPIPPSLPSNSNNTQDSSSSSSSYTTNQTVALMIYIDDADRFETWDGWMTNVSVCFAVDGRVVCSNTSVSAGGGGLSGGGVGGFGGGSESNLNLNSNSNSNSSLGIQPPVNAMSSNNNNNNNSNNNKRTLHSHSNPNIITPAVTVTQPHVTQPQPSQQQTPTPPPPPSTLSPLTPSPNFTGQVLSIPSTQQLYPTVSLHSIGTSVISRFSKGDLKYGTRRCMSDMMFCVRKERLRALAANGGVKKDGSGGNGGNGGGSDVELDYVFGEGVVYGVDGSVLYDASESTFSDDDDDGNGDGEPSTETEGEGEGEMEKEGSEGSNGSTVEEEEGEGRSEQDTESDEMERDSEGRAV